MKFQNNYLKARIGLKLLEGKKGLHYDFLFGFPLFSCFYSQFYLVFEVVNNVGEGCRGLVLAPKIWMSMCAACHHNVNTIIS